MTPYTHGDLRHTGLITGSIYASAYPRSLFHIDGGDIKSINTGQDWNHVIDLGPSTKMLLA